MKISVSTGKLREAAGMTVGSIDRIAGEFEQMESTVRGSADYWEGKGHFAYMRSFNKRNDKVREDVEWFRTDLIKLEKMAGIYEAAEEEIKESSEPLPMDVII